MNIDFSKILNFNSSVVRLKESDKNGGSIELNIFQFQCGAIKRFSKFSMYVGSMKFQFQCGAIKSVDLIFEYKSKSNFNSSVVRLKVSMLGTGQLENFISIPVWCD